MWRVLVWWIVWLGVGELMSSLPKMIVMMPMPIMPMPMID